MKPRTKILTIRLVLVYNNHKQKVSLIQKMKFRENKWFMGK